VRLLTEQRGSYTARGKRYAFQVPVGALGTVTRVLPYASPLPYVVTWDDAPPLSVAEQDLEPAPAPPPTPANSTARRTALDVWAQLPPLGG
jgi:hypothetical protein